MSMCLLKSINYTQKQEVITMKITGECVKAKMGRCRTRKKKITKSLAILMGIEKDELEIIKPKQIDKGILFTIYVYANKENVDFEKSGDVFKSGWGLSSTPVVSDVKTMIIESKEVRKSTEIKGENGNEKGRTEEVTLKQMERGAEIEMMKSNPM